MNFFNGLSFIGVIFQVYNVFIQNLSPSEVIKWKTCIIGNFKLQTRRLKQKKRYGYHIFTIKILFFTFRRYYPKT